MRKTKNIFYEQKGYIVVERSFADELKTAVAEPYDFPVEQCYSQEGKNTTVVGTGKTVGQLLQEFGTNARLEDENVWVNAVNDFFEISKNTATGEKPLVFIVPDVRFPNEVSWIDGQDFDFTVRLNGDPCNVFAESKRDKNHISETALDDFQGFDIILNTDEQSAADCARIVKLFTIKQFTDKTSQK